MSAVYHLTTKSRQVVVDGISTPFYLLKYTGEAMDAFESIRNARFAILDDAWLGYEYPEYVVHGSFVDGATVYTNWPSDSDTHPMVCIVDDDNRPFADFSGYIRAKGRRFTFERWNKITQKFHSRDERNNAFENMHRLLGNNEYTTDYYKPGIFQYNKKPIRVEFVSGTYTLEVSYRDDNDGVFIKMAL